MNLHPLSVKRILYIDSDNADVRSHGRNRDLVLIVAARCLGISLSHRKFADNLEYQVSLPRRYYFRYSTSIAVE
jgi:hypothetical protein